MDMDYKETAERLMSLTDDRLYTYMGLDLDKTVSSELYIEFWKEEEKPRYSYITKGLRFERDSISEKLKEYTQQGRQWFAEHIEDLQHVVCEKEYVKKYAISKNKKVDLVLFIAEKLVDMRTDIDAVGGIVAAILIVRMGLDVFCETCK